MEDNLKCRAALRTKSIVEKSRSLNSGLVQQTEDEKLNSLEGRIFIPKMRFLESVKVFGFWRSLSAKLLRIRYMSALWLIRESSILKILSANYEKVPAYTVSKIIAFPPISSLLARLMSFLSARIYPVTDMKNLSVSAKMVSK